MDGVELKNRLKRAYFFDLYIRRIIFVAVGLFLNEEKLIAP